MDTDTEAPVGHDWDKLDEALHVEKRKMNALDRDLDVADVMAVVKKWAEKEAS